MTPGGTAGFEGVAGKVLNNPVPGLGEHDPAVGGGPDRARHYGPAPDLDTPQPGPG